MAMKDENFAPNNGLVPEETEVLNALGAAWNLFVILDESHPSDHHEFMLAIHAAQNIVLARIGKRVIDKRNASVK